MIGLSAQAVHVTRRKLMPFVSGCGYQTGQGVHEAYVVAEIDLWGGSFLYLAT